MPPPDALGAPAAPAPPPSAAPAPSVAPAGPSVDPRAELGGLHDMAPATRPSVPWVAPPDEPTAPRANNPFGQALLDEDLPHDEADEPLDPFAERTLPGHLVGSLPDDEPAGFDEGAPTAADVPRPALATPAPATSAPATSAPATSAPATSAPATSAPATPTAPVPTPPPGAPAPAAPAPVQTAPTPPAAPAPAPTEQEGAAGAEEATAAALAREVPRAITAIVSLDAGMRERLGLLAEASEAAEAEGEAGGDAFDTPVGEPPRLSSAEGPATVQSAQDLHADPAPARGPAPAAAEAAQSPSAPAARSGAERASEASPEPPPPDRAVAALLAAGVVTPEAVEAAQRAKESRGGKLSELLVTLGHTTDEVVADTLAAASKRMRLSERDLGARLPHPDLCRRLPQPYALGRRMLPLKLEGERLTLALADPFDHSGIREVARLLGAKQVLPQVTARGALTEATLKAYRSLGARLAGEGQPSVLLCMADEDEIARFGARLADEGFHVAHAADVPTAKMLLDSHPPAALVLGLDVKAPESLLVFARGSDAHADTPLFVTGESRDDDMLASLLDLGADDFFERPANLNLVLAKLRRALNKRAAASGAPAGPRSDDTSGASASTPSVPRLPASLMTPPPDDATPPPTFDFWENSGPLPAAPEAPPGDTSDDPPMYGEPTGVMGTLRQMAVAEIVQSLELGRKTARVELVPAEGQRGMVGFEDGQVVYAECGAVLGEDAFYELARHTEGFFRIRYGEAPSSRNIEGSTTFLLLEAMRRMDEEDGGSESGGGEPVGAEKTPTPFE